jgi:molecular chaperone GrpE
MAEKPVTDPTDAPSAVSDPHAQSPDDLPVPEGEQLVSADPVADLQRERDDYHDRWMRKAAEFENYRKRIERERREQADQAVVGLLQALLPVVDDFDRALTAEAGQSAAAYRKGVELIRAKLHDLLRRQGVRPIEALGTDFDPNIHQAVMQETSPDHRDGEVIEELTRGYKIGDRLLRPAMVKVAKRS